MRSVTIDHGGGLRSSVSYLSEILVETGMRGHRRCCDWEVRDAPTVRRPCISRCGSMGSTSTRSLHLLCGAGEPEPPVSPSSSRTGVRPGLGGQVAGPAVPILVDVRSGLLGGTFDPPHIAHLLAGEVAYRQLRLDRIIYLPAGSPWQKADRKVSSAASSMAR